MKNKKIKFENYTIKPAFTDTRGDIIDILEEKVGHVGLITFKKGAVRGNHYHKKSVQYTYVLKGTIKLVVSDEGGKHKRTYILKEGSFNKIPPGMIHTYTALVSSQMLDMTTLSRKDSGYEKDTYRV